MQTASRIGFSAVGAVALLVSMTVGAEAQQPGDGRVRVDTLADGRIVVSNPDSPQTGPRGVSTFVEELRIGSLDGTCDAFGDVASLAVDGDGRIYVADRQARAIRVFAPQGECVRTFGRSGEGPGEFRWLEGIAWQPPGYLWAIDAIQSRLTVFDSLGTVLATHPVNLGPGASMPWPLWVDAGGSLHIWLQGFRSLVKYGSGPGLDSLDSFRVPEIPRELYTQTNVGNTGISARSTIPYSPAIRWTVSPAGNLWLANSSTYAIHETTYAGDTLRTVQLDRRVPRLEGRERDSIAAAIGIAARRLPARKSVVERIRSSPDGWLWIETDKGAIRAWDVFDERGYYMGRVASPVPIEKEPFPVFGRGTVTAVTRDELGVQYVVRLRLGW
ncbi:MAG: 6-bladed beta-propeller [Gemmatimonadetes bacterium]|nr:6-bladed beta-propeller [Gemmatimonadota bacterium]